MSVNLLNSGWLKNKIKIEDFDKAEEIIKSVGFSLEVIQLEGEDLEYYIFQEGEPPKDNAYIIKDPEGNRVGVLYYQADRKMWETSCQTKVELEKIKVLEPWFWIWDHSDFEDLEDDN